MTTISAEFTFVPLEPLFSESAAEDCRACVVIPACNEEGSLRACLEALSHQQNLSGGALPSAAYEVLLLLNNCTDRSRQVAEAVQQARPAMRLSIAERHFPSRDAHAGTARKLLMDTAWHRLRGFRDYCGAAILSTDADSIVASDWIARNLSALEAGADAVGGLIKLLPKDLAVLPPSVRRCYLRDRRYAELIAILEDALDPQAGDPLPRHLDHFGSSLACTRGAYAKCGGLPALPSLEDEAFVDRLRRAGLRLRHDPRVVVFTSARVQGRAAIGMAGQLRLWSELNGEHDHVVTSAAYLAHRFRTLHALRLVFTTGNINAFAALKAEDRDLVVTALEKARTVPSFLDAVDCDALIARSFRGEPDQPIQDAIRDLSFNIKKFHLSDSSQQGNAVLRSALIGDGIPLASTQP